MRSTNGGERGRSETGQQDVRVGRHRTTLEQIRDDLRPYDTASASAATPSATANGKLPGATPGKELAAHRQMLDELVQLGVEKEHAHKALKAVRYASLNSALEWLTKNVGISTSQQDYINSNGHSQDYRAPSTSTANNHTPLAPKNSHPGGGNGNLHPFMHATSVEDSGSSRSNSPLQLASPPPNTATYSGQSSNLNYSPGGSATGSVAGTPSYIASTTYSFNNQAMSPSPGRTRGVTPTVPDYHRSHVHLTTGHYPVDTGAMRLGQPRPMIFVESIPTEVSAPRSTPFMRDYKSPLEGSLPTMMTSSAHMSPTASQSHMGIYGGGQHPVIRGNFNAPPSSKSTVSIHVAQGNKNEGRVYRLDYTGLDGDVSSVHGMSGGVTGVQSIMVDPDTSKGFVVYEDELRKKERAAAPPAYPYSDLYPSPSKEPTPLSATTSVPTAMVATPRNTGMISYGAGKLAQQQQPQPPLQGHQILMSHQSSPIGGSRIQINGAKAGSHISVQPSSSLMSGPGIPPSVPVGHLMSGPSGLGMSSGVGHHQITSTMMNSTGMSGPLTSTVGVPQMISVSSGMPVGLSGAVGLSGIGGLSGLGGLQNPGMSSSHVQITPTSSREPRRHIVVSRQQGIPSAGPEASTSSTGGGVRRSGSPLPDVIIRRLERCREQNIPYEGQREPCAPKMFCFFMEQHAERLGQQYRLRLNRQRQLEKEMETANLPENLRASMLSFLHKKESKYTRLRRQKMNKDMFTVIRDIGVGAFGRVSLVKKKDSGQVYAMKSLGKKDIILRQQAAHVKAERDILAEADSEWIVKLFFSFQDDRCLYFIMEYVPGGDLMQLLINKGVFTESLSQFYIAELTCALDYVHSLGFIHRDIKPDNILIDQLGHIKLTDFGLCTGLRWTHDRRYYGPENDTQPSHARVDSFSLPPEALEQEMKVLSIRQQKKRNKAHSIVGTGNYMAPEVVNRTGHTQLCDWWSVGVILYEMVFGRPPFYSHTDDPRETQAKITNWRQHLDVSPRARAGMHMKPLSNECISMIRGLCCDEADRLGSKGGAAQVKAHSWFKDFNFKELRTKRPEYVPRVEHAEDTSNFDLDHFEQFQQSPFETMGKRAPANPAFYEFTFRHFFDMDGMGCPTFRSSPRRPGLGPLMDQGGGGGGTSATTSGYGGSGGGRSSATSAGTSAASSAASQQYQQQQHFRKIDEDSSESIVI